MMAMKLKDKVIEIQIGTKQQKGLYECLHDMILGKCIREELPKIDFIKNCGCTEAKHIVPLSFSHSFRRSQNANERRWNEVSNG